MFRTLLLVMAVPLLAGEMDDIRKEPDPLRRSERALDFADREIKEAHDMPGRGDSAKVAEVLAQLADACEVSLQALRDTGKRAGKLTKYYKKGELKTREYLRRLESLIPALNYEDRARAEPFQTRLTATHEEYLLGVMSK